MSLEQGTVEQILESLGIEVTDSRGEELQAHCPVHKKRTGKDDAHPSWYINAETGKHLCFSCGFKGPLEYLLMVVKGYDDVEAAQYLQTLGAQLDIDSLQARLNAALNREGEVQLARPTRAVPESRLALYTSPPRWALDARGLTPEVAERYDVRWDSRADLWITPLRNSSNGQLIGWQEKGERIRVFKNVPPNMRKSGTLFGWHAVEGAEVVVAVESPLDAVKVAACTPYAGVAFCGAMVSEAQYLLLRALSQSRRVVVAFDNPKVDKAGRHAAHALLSAADRLGFDVWFFAYGDTDAKDIGEMRPAEIDRGIWSARHRVRGRLAVSA